MDKNYTSRDRQLPFESYLEEFKPRKLLAGEFFGRDLGYVQMFTLSDLSARRGVT